MHYTLALAMALACGITFANESLTLTTLQKRQIIPNDESGSVTVDHTKNIITCTKDDEEKQVVFILAFDPIQPLESTQKAQLSFRLQGIGGGFIGNVSLIAKNNDGHETLRKKLLAITGYERLTRFIWELEIPKHTKHIELGLDIVKPKAICNIDSPNLKFIVNIPNPDKAPTLVWPDFTPIEVKQQLLKDENLNLKLEQVDMLRKKRANTWNPMSEKNAKTNLEHLEKILDNGCFEDYTDEKIYDYLLKRGTHYPEEKTVEVMLEYAAARLVEASRLCALPKYKNDKRIQEKFLKCASYYFTREIERPRSRLDWCSGAFLLPSAACSVYFSAFDKMQAVESGDISDPLAVKVNRLCRIIAPRCYTEQPRFDVLNPFDLEHFRNSGAWTGGNFGYRPLLDAALVCRNPKMLDTLYQICANALSVSSWNTRKSAFWMESMTADGAAWGHGVQGYVWGYPMSGIEAVLKVLTGLKGTFWQQSLNIDNLMLVANYAEGSMWYIYQPNGYTLMAPGRQSLKFGNFNTQKHGAILANRLDELVPETETVHKKRIETIRNIAMGTHPENTGNRYFWNNDDMIHRRQNYYIGINMTSARSASTEVIDVDTSHTEFFGSGVTFIMLRPDAFCTLKGFWEFSALPGTTARQCELHDNYQNWGGYKGKHNFAGGVSDGTIGACAFKFEIAPEPKFPQVDIYGTRAHKAYFALESSLVCLGAGIQDDTGKAEVRTCVNQVLWNPDAKISQGGKNFNPIMLGTDETIKNSDKLLIWNDQIGYDIRGNANVRIQATKRNDKWMKIYRNANRNIENKPEKMDVLDIRIQHGTKPYNESYQYIVYPNCQSTKDLRNYADENDIQILENTTQLQAIQQRSTHVVQAVFYAPGTLKTDELDINVTTPVNLMLKKKQDGKWIGFVADPTQNPDLKTIEIEVNGKITVVEMPQEPYCGQTATFTFK